MSKVLALDYGEKRVGVAISDEHREYVFARQPLANRGKKALFAMIAEIVQHERVDLIVVGLPLTLRGERGKQATAIQEVMCELEEALHVPVDFEDERFTTSFASRFPSSRARQDSIAASAILESYLARKRAHHQEDNL